ncbi:hypothetical protein P692DRAFT_201291735 [Suillus brevipes Sb2]|nr:hypothetical protein P692DRAFT_201291735 [Suillus brevipes Sb2]
MSCHFRTIVRTRGAHIAVPGGSLTQLGAIVLWRTWRDHSLQACADRRVCQRRDSVVCGRQAWEPGITSGRWKIPRPQRVSLMVINSFFAIMIVWTNVLRFQRLDRSSRPDQYPATQWLQT